MEKKIQDEFWKNKDIRNFSKEEWESICDGCGQCCFRKYIDGYLWWKKILYTRIACDCLDLDTNLCTCYECRFEKQNECLQLDPNKLGKFKWLPETCSYRLLKETGKLPSWHPLLNGGDRSKVPVIYGAVHEKDVDENNLDMYLL